MTEFKNILVVRSDRIGDVVLTIPAVRALKKAFPKARVSIWVADSTRELVDGLPFIDEVLVEETVNGWAGYWRFLAKLRSKRFDLAIIYHTKRHTNLTCFLAGIPSRLGYRNNKFGFFLNLPVEDRRHFGEKHEAYYCLDLLRAIGVESTDITLELPRTDQADAWVSNLFKQHDLDGKTVVAVHPDASCATRRWPPALFAGLIERLDSETGARVLLIGDSGAKHIAEEIRGRTKAAFLDLTGRTSLSQMAGIFKRCRVVISNDSGPVHIGAAVGVPVISLFFRSQPGINPQRWRPLGAQSILLCNKPGEAILLDRKGKIVSGNLGSISVDEVFAKARAVIKP